jgi:hypothetical protein
MSKFAVGTCRALVYTFGPQIVVCHRCRKFIGMPKLDVPYDPCPFVCKNCGDRGEIKDRVEAPEDRAPTASRHVGCQVQH